MTLVGVHHLRFLDFTMTSKKRVDNHVIKSLRLLQNGELPTSKLIHEPRDVFWIKNDFEVDWEEIGGFSFGFRVLNQTPALYLVPHERDRSIRVDLYTSGLDNNGFDHNEYWI